MLWDRDSGVDLQEDPESELAVLFSTPLMVPRDALVAGTCKFVKLTAEERKKRQAVYLEKIKLGEIEPQKHKRRSDAGSRKKLKRAHPEVDTANDGADGADSTHKSQELIDNSDSAC